jgi:hypothetical protein
VKSDVLDGHAIAHGAAIGLLLFVPLSAVRVLIDQNVATFDHSGWAPVFAVALFVVYVVAGLVAARAAPDAPLSNAIVAAVGAFLLWIPIRMLIWAIRDASQGLFSGTDPVFTPARILGQIVFAAAFGAVGGWLAARRAAHRGSVDA